MAFRCRCASRGRSRQITPSRVGEAARLSRSWSVSGPNRDRLASDSTTSRASTWSMVMPYRTDWLPAELLPIIPPSVARVLVEVSGPNMSPCGAAARFSCSWTTPGCTRATRCSASISVILLMCRDRSITIACPTVWTARLVPAPRGSIAGEDHADRLDGVHARGAGEQVLAVGVEADLAADHGAQRRRDIPSITRRLVPHARLHGTMLVAAAKGQIDGVPQRPALPPDPWADECPWAGAAGDRRTDNRSPWP